MDFTRQPIIETVITPREGCKLVVRSSKGIGQEEYFVDSLEVVSFGGCFFFRSLERPKCFLVPVSDYEVIEVRETRMVLRHVAPDRASPKIPQQREQTLRPSREPRQEPQQLEEPSEVEEEPIAVDVRSEGRADKKRDRRRHQRRRRGRDERDETLRTTSPEEGPQKENDAKIEVSAAERVENVVLGVDPVQPQGNTSLLSTLLPPPSMLISDTIARYKDNDLFRGVFIKEERPSVKIAEGDSIESLEDESESLDLDIFTSHPWDAEQYSHQSGEQEQTQEVHLDNDEEISEKQEETSKNGNENF